MNLLQAISVAQAAGIVRASVRELAARAAESDWETAVEKIPNAHNCRAIEDTLKRVMNRAGRMREDDIAAEAELLIELVESRRREIEGEPVAERTA